MENIYELIITTFQRGTQIPLIGGGFDTYIATSQTIFRSNPNIFYEAILFEIGQNRNRKRVSRHFIELTYQYYVNSNMNFPNRNWYRNHHNPLIRAELSSRPCNLSVTRGLIIRVL